MIQDTCEEFVPARPRAILGGMWSRTIVAAAVATALLAGFPSPAVVNDDPCAYDSEGKPVKMNWPPNPNVVDGFVECFGNSYNDAYNTCCRPFSREQKRAQQPLRPSLFLDAVNQEN